MARVKNSTRLNWLAATLSEQRSRIADLLSKMTCFGPRSSLTPSMFRKFIDMLDQIAEAKAAENHTLDRIENVEKIHHARRKTRQLRRAGPKARKGIVEYENEPECERPGNGLLNMLTFWYLFMRKDINHKKQSLTID